MADHQPAPPTEDEPRPDRPNGSTDLAAGLTPIEQRIFDALVAGKTRRQICREQAIGHTAYDTYVRLARRHLGAATTIEALILYVRAKAGADKDEAGSPPG